MFVIILFELQPNIITVVEKRIRNVCQHVKGQIIA